MFDLAFVRGCRVILDVELAAMFAVPTKRLNEQVKRNASRFSDWAFQLTDAELADLRSQSATSSLGWGGRRSRPWVFTEHGVVMAATVLNSDTAVLAVRLVVDAFVSARLRGFGPPSALAATPGLVSPNGLGSRLQRALDALLDTVVDQRREITVREEAQALIASSIQHLKDRLSRAGLENEEVAARAAKLLAEAEATKAVAAKTSAEAGEIELRTLARKLRLIIEAERAMAQDDLGDFLRVLEDLGRP